MSVARRTIASTSTRAPLVLTALLTATISAACREESSEPRARRSGDGDDMEIEDESTPLAEGGAPHDTADAANDGGVRGACEQAPASSTRFAETGESLSNGAVARIGHVIDGDTLDVVFNDVRYRVRLQGIDAPECNKDNVEVPGQGRRLRCRAGADNDHFGYEAYCTLVDLASGADVRVECDGRPEGAPCPTDDFGRVLPFLRLDDGEDLAERMARVGAAWSFTAFESVRRARYCEAEDLATAEGLGMWSISRASVIEQMPETTISWYTQRDRRCAEAE